MQRIWDFTRQHLAKTQDFQKYQADKKRVSLPKYQLEDRVWLSTKNIQTSRSFKMLIFKWIGPYSIKRVVSEACELDLSSSIKIHNIFHTSLLRPAFEDSLSR
jgi:hypothetical protein